MQGVRRMHQQFYRNPNREQQNNSILKYVGVIILDRHRSQKDMVNRGVTTHYFMPSQKNGAVSTKRVCKEFFMQTLGIKKDFSYRYYAGNSILQVTMFLMEEVRIREVQSTHIN